nr:type VI secretion system tip protein VgrG [Salinicola tamaricis]
MTHRRPVIGGPQTATVVGPANEEIHTDHLNRVRVQFHWDRQGQHDENASVWLRVSQPNAGAGWGGVFVPRIGQEVLVDFLEGDADRPLITGRVYNGEQTPDWHSHACSPGSRARPTAAASTMSWCSTTPPTRSGCASTPKRRRASSTSAT